MTLRTLTLVTLLSLLVGCSTTHLSVQELPKTSGAQAPQGAVYFLPTVEFGVEHRRELLECPVGPGVVRAWLKKETSGLVALGNNLEGLDQATLPGGEAARRQTLKTRLQIDDQELNLLGSLPDGHLPSDQKLSTAENVLPMQRGLVKLLLVDGFKDYKGLRSAEADELLADLDGLGWAAIKDRLAALIRSSLRGPTELELKIGHAVTLAPRYYPDYGQGYAIAHSNLASGLKETDLKLDKYPNGTLKSINATITDRTAEVIGSTVRGALRIAAALQGIPLPAFDAATGATDAEPEAASPPRVPRSLKISNLCKPSILALVQERRRTQAELEPTLAAIRAKQREIDAANEALEGRKGKLSSAEKRLEGMEKDDPKRAEVEKEVKDLKASVKAQGEVVAKLGKEKKALETRHATDLSRIAALRKQLTHTQLQTFRPGTTPPRQEEIIGAFEASRAWFENSALTDCYFCKQSENCSMIGNTQVPTVLRAWVAAYLPGLNLVSSGMGTKIEGSSESHLVYREPARGDLLVCKEKACLGPASPYNLVATTEDIVKSEPTSFPQLGALATLPLQNGPFQNNTIVAQFAESGSLTHFEYKTNARAQTAAQAFETAAGDIDAFAQARRDANKSQLDQEKDEITAEKDKVKAQLELEQALEELDAFRRGELEEDGDEEEEGGDDEEAEDGQE